MPNGNGKHKTQIDRFKAEIVHHGGEDPLCEWGTSSGLPGFTFHGDIYRVNIPGTRNPVSRIWRNSTPS